MIVTRTKVKTIIVKVAITKLERFKPFEIRLPANVSKVTGILVTASAKASGTVSFQTNDKLDVFYVAQITEPGVEQSDETLLNIKDAQFESDSAWVTGYVPKMKAVYVEGDTALIHAWYKAERFDVPFTLKVYIECVLAEELTHVVADEKEIQTKEEAAASAMLDPMEIHL